VRDNGPGPHPIELSLQGVELHSVILQSVYHPHGEVCDQQKRNQLFSWFLVRLFLRVTSPLPRVQHQDRLAHALDQGGYGCYDPHDGPAGGHVHGKVRADDLEQDVQEETSLRYEQKDMFQLEASASGYPPDVSNRKQARDDGAGSSSVHYRLPDIHLHKKA